MQFCIVVSIKTVIQNAAWRIVPLMIQCKGRVQKEEIERLGEGFAAWSEKGGLDGVVEVFLEGFEVFEGVVGFEVGPVELLLELLDFLGEERLLFDSRGDLFFEVGELFLDWGLLYDDGFDFLGFAEISLERLIVVLELFKLLLGGGDGVFEFRIDFMELFVGQLKFLVLFQLSL